MRLTAATVSLAGIEPFRHIVLSQADTAELAGNGGQCATASLAFAATSVF
jgi:hypothetical protein